LIFDRYNYENISYEKLDSSREELEKVSKMCKLENKSEVSYIYLSGVKNREYILLGH
jgi:hypothetical protein